MGNLGSSELVPILKTIIEDRKMHQKIRLDAIYALRRVAKPCRKEVCIIVSCRNVLAVKSLLHEIQ